MKSQEITSRCTLHQRISSLRNSFCSYSAGYRPLAASEQNHKLKEPHLFQKRLQGKYCLNDLVLVDFQWYEVLHYSIYRNDYKLHQIVAHNIGVLHNIYCKVCLCFQQTITHALNVNSLFLKEKYSYIPCTIRQYHRQLLLREYSNKLLKLYKKIWTPQYTNKTFTCKLNIYKPTLHPVEIINHSPAVPAFTITGAGETNRIGVPLPMPRTLPITIEPFWS